jgi:hypothetical protein
MRFMAVIMLALAGVGALGAAASPAQAQTYPWCIVYIGPNGDGGEHCMFVSYGQCMLTATPGSGGVCVRNPHTFWARGNWW